MTFIGWLAGEIIGARALRIACGLLTIGLATAIALGIGWFLGGANASLATTEATHDFLNVVVEEIDAGRAERALEELRGVAESTERTYEGVRFDRIVEEATRRLRSH